MDAIKRKAERSCPPAKKTYIKFFRPVPQPSKGVAGENVDCAEEFTTTLQNTKKIEQLLADNGFVIIRNVLNAAECQEIIDGVWDSMEKITADLEIPLDRNNRQTWASMKKQENIRNMYSQHGIVHAEFFWKLRQHPNILAVFSLLYNCQPKDLLASFDGLCMQTPPEYSTRGRGWYHSSWYHVDQSYTRPKKECFQSWVTARDVRPNDYTIGFFKGSHKSFREFGEKFGIKKRGDLNKLETPEQMEFYESRHQQIRITCPAGSLVVWDSRLLHSGLEPLRGREKPNFRTVCYLSYGPRHDVRPHILQKRIDLFRKRRATSHWTHVHMRTIPDKPPTESRIWQLQTEPLQTDLLKWLVGFPESEMSNLKQTKLTTFM